MSAASMDHRTKVSKDCLTGGVVQEFIQQAGHHKLPTPTDSHYIRGDIAMAKPENGYEFKVNGEQFEAGIPELTALGNTSY